MCTKPRENLDLENILYHLSRFRLSKISTYFSCITWPHSYFISTSTCTLHTFPITSNTLKSHYLPNNIVSLYFDMASFPCGQSGCSRMFSQRSDLTNHIQHHHLSPLNIQLNIHVQHQPPSPPSPCQQSKSSSPPLQPSELQVPKIVDDDDGDGAP